ncbi:hypothetical protein [Gordonia sp. DT101]|uniref:hypothetical protein n=1 Tax=Gordonia sp. DT101 TaxID=3416545 RepID=UPI003CF451AC
MTPVLHHLGLLTDDELDQVNAHLERADLASHTAYKAHTVTTASAETVAAKLAADPKVDAARILKATADIPAQSEIDAVCKALYESSVNAARKLAFANAVMLPHKLTEQFQRVCDEHAALLPELVGVRSDRDAIDTGRIEPWKRLRDLQDVYENLRGIQQLASDNSLIPTPHMPGEHGEHFKFRLAHDRMQTLGSDEFGEFAEIIRRQPYVPSSRDEALAVAESWR